MIKDVYYKFNLNHISEEITTPWSPKDIETVNNAVIRIAQFDGQYHWHKHDSQDEIFLVFKGKISIQTRNGEILLNENEGCHRWTSHQWHPGLHQ